MCAGTISSVKPPAAIGAALAGPGAAPSCPQRVGCWCGGRVEAPRAPDGTCGPSGRRPRTIAARPTGAGMTHTILVVEDEAEIRSLLRGYLERAGYSVLTTGSGAEALTLAASASPA